MRVTKEKLIFYFASFFAFTTLTIAVYTFLPVHDNANPPLTWGFSVDWKGCIRPDTILLVTGRSPYAEGCGLNPPWTYLLLTPIAALPPDVGAAVMFTVTYFVYALAFIKIGAKPWMVLGLLVSPFVFTNAQNGNIDWLPIIGYILPPQIGLFFVVIKPQIGAGIALFWLVEAWRTGRFREVVRVFAPVTIVFLLSFAIYGLYPLRLINMPKDAYNASIWPYGLIIGIPLLAFALYKRKRLLSIAATPFFAPYINVHSYGVVFLALTSNPIVFVVFCALPWIINLFFS